MNKMIPLIIATLLAINSALASDKCIFGDSLSDLQENSRFVVQEDVLSTFKLYPELTTKSYRPDKPLLVSVSIITDKKTGHVYHSNTTFRHVDDGDNTMGWIEEVNDAAKYDDGVENEGRVVALINDSDIDHCLMTEKAKR